MPRNLPKKEYNKAVVEDKKKRDKKMKEIRDKNTIAGKVITDAHLYAASLYCESNIPIAQQHRMLLEKFPDSKIKYCGFTQWHRTEWFQTLVTQYNSISQEKFLNDFLLRDQKRLEALDAILAGDPTYAKSASAIVKEIENRMLAGSDPLIKKAGNINFNQQVNNIMTDSKTMRETWTKEQMALYAATGEKPKEIN